MEHVANYISSESTITGNANVRHWAGDYIPLNPEFEVDTGSIFSLEINRCALPAATIND